MVMKIQVLSYGITLISLLILDGVWLLVVMSNVYKRNLSHLLADSVTLWPVVVFYSFYAFGICFFVTRNALSQNLTVTSTFASGALLGLIAYSAYDLTNQATLRDWPIVITIVDILWGGIVTGLAALIGVYATKVIFKTLT